jgi:hypothetical protein
MAVGSSRADDTDDVVDSAPKVIRLLENYDHALSAIERRPAVVWVPNLSDSHRWLGRRLLAPRANFMASRLAERHIATRISVLVRRGERLRAVEPQSDPLFDLERVQHFQDSLNPPSRRALVLWTLVFSLAIAFPVAWVTDHLRSAIPRLVVCGSLSVNHFFQAQLLSGGHAGSSAPACRAVHVRSAISVVAVFSHMAHLGATPGGAIDALGVLRHGGIDVALLFVSVFILCVCVVLAVFRSGFRLKRLEFSLDGPPQGHESIQRAAQHSDGLYRMERDAFEALNLAVPREFPLDLVVSAGFMVLPFTIAGALVAQSVENPLAWSSRCSLLIVAAGLCAAAAVRLHTLGRLWRSRLGRTRLEPRERWLPDGSTVLVHSAAYTAILVASAYLLWAVWEMGTHGLTVGTILVSFLLVGPVCSWPLAAPWWYKLHRELTTYGTCVERRLGRRPTLSLVAPACIVPVWVLELSRLGPSAISGWGENVVITSFIVGLVGTAVSLYRMGRHLALAKPSPARPERARFSGLAMMVGFSLCSPALVLYVQRVANGLWRAVARTEPWPRGQSYELEPVVGSEATSSVRDRPGPVRMPLPDPTPA